MWGGRIMPRAQWNIKPAFCSLPLFDPYGRNPTPKLTLVSIGDRSIRHVFLSTVLSQLTGGSAASSPFDSCKILKTRPLNLSTGEPL
jgi:hypothetical protein